MSELDRKSWYMVATDSQTLLKELARQSYGAEPRDAGLDTWNQLMSMIGRKDTANEHTGDFDDLMLKEWALENLLSTAAGGGGGLMRTPEEKKPEEDVDRPKPIDELLERVVSSTRPSAGIAEGSLVRSKDMVRSPFLLSDQELHKAILLIVSEDENLMVGAMLNRPSARGIDIQIKDKRTGRTQVEKVPVRYGGQFAAQGRETLLWLHNNESMKIAGIGSEVGTNRSGIWKCTADDVSTAIGRNLARPEDFMVVSGVVVWAKDGTTPQGMNTPIKNSNFEQVHETKVKKVWESMMVQEVLSKDNLKSSVLLANDSWERGMMNIAGWGSRQQPNTNPPMAGLGENFDEENGELVFKSDVKVSDLGDTALGRWLATFLLGWPNFE